MTLVPNKLRARDLRVGGRYLHINGEFVREIVAIEGETVHWRDQFSSGQCSKSAFLKRCPSVAEEAGSSAETSNIGAPPHSGEFTVRDEANALTACAFRNGFIEELHAGKASPLREMPGFSRISDAEMKRLMSEVSAKLAELLLMRQSDPKRYEGFLRKYHSDYCQGWERKPPLTDKDKNPKG